MADHIRIRRADGTWTIRAGGAVLGESTNALERDRRQPTPSSSTSRAATSRWPSSTAPTATSTCPWKGEANYFSIVTKSTTLRDAAWSYENPKPGMEAIKDHIAFYATDQVVDRTDLTVSRPEAPAPRPAPPPSPYRPTASARSRPPARPDRAARPGSWSRRPSRTSPPASDAPQAPPPAANA